MCVCASTFKKIRICNVCVYVFTYIHIYIYILFLGNILVFLHMILALISNQPHEKPDFGKCHVFFSVTIDSMDRIIHFFPLNLQNQ